MNIAILPDSVIVYRSIRDKSSKISHYKIVDDQVVIKPAAFSDYLEVSVYRNDLLVDDNMMQQMTNSKDLSGGWLSY